MTQMISHVGMISSFTNNYTNKNSENSDNIDKSYAMLIGEKEKYIDKEWRRSRKFILKQLQTGKFRDHQFDPVRHPDPDHVRSVIDRNYGLQRDLVYFREENHLHPSEQYPDFFEKGGFEGLSNEAGCVTSCFERDPLRKVRALRDEVLQYAANVLSINCYRKMVNEKDFNVLEYLDQIIVKEATELYGMDEAELKKYMLPKIDKMREFAILERELRRQEKLSSQISSTQTKKSVVGKKWEDVQQPGKFNEYIGDHLPKVIELLCAKYDSEEIFTKLSKLKTKIATTGNENEDEELEHLKLKDGIYKDFIRAVCFTYPHLKEMIPSLTQNSFCGLWARRLEMCPGMGRKRSEIYKHLRKDLTYVKNRNFSRKDVVMIDATKMFPFIPEPEIVFF